MTTPTIPNPPTATGVNSVRQHKRLCNSQKRNKRPHLIAKYGMQCFWCDCKLTTETLTIDHYVPLSRGGSNKIKNLRLACFDCNQGRGNALPEEMQQLYAFV
ncbi:HNH endonuclease [Halotia wernerae UHCC 0503]|nr:HNH endonuclease [Halotia wernerae UHCC 0503]